MLLTRTLFLRAALKHSMHVFVFLFRVRTATFLTLCFAYLLTACNLGKVPWYQSHMAPASMPDDPQQLRREVARQQERDPLADMRKFVSEKKRKAGAAAAAEDSGSRRGRPGDRFAPPPPPATVDPHLASMLAAQRSRELDERKKVCQLCGAVYRCAPLRAGRALHHPASRVCWFTSALHRAC